MKIQFSRDLILEDWSSNSDNFNSETIWYRYRKSNIYNDNILVTLRKVKVEEFSYCYSNFYNELYFLHYDRYGDPYKWNPDFEIAKQEVDNFLIRMSKLKSFW
jgi:hypothetical protein